MDTPALAMRMPELPAARIDGAGRLKPARGDHVARYQWAAERLRGHVIDAGCNCGYGAAILADAGLDVTAIDIWPMGLEYARQYWNRPEITWRQADLEQEGLALPDCDAVVAFEVIEHLERPERLLTAARLVAGQLLASVPNEAVWPYQVRLAPTHKRHYRRAELDKLLRRCGWSEIEWFGQKQGWSPVEPEIEGRTLVVACR